MSDEIKPLSEEVTKKHSLLKEVAVAQTESQIDEMDNAHFIRLICHFAALGMEQKEIAKQIGTTPGKVKLVLSSQTARNEVKRLQYELFMKDPQKPFINEMPKAFRRMKSIMYKKEAKDADVLRAIENVFDRALGKPVQEIHHEGSTIRQLFEALDEIKKQTHTKKQENIAPIIDADFKEVEPEKDEMEKWLDENL